MSVHRRDQRWIVRWREGARQRSKSFHTKREAIEFDRWRRADAWRDSIATARGAVPLKAADEGMSFHVVEDLYGDLDHLDPNMRSGQRPIHEGLFRTIRDADAYRRQMPDADALNIGLLYDRYPLRDLTDAEIVAGEVSPTADDERHMRTIEQARGRTR